MIPRICNLSKSRSFLLLGPRSTGKSTLIKGWIKGKSVQIYNLLEPAVEAQLMSRPEKILEDWRVHKSDWIVIDEIQKIPKLLDVVHQGIESYKIKFGITGSSARKLRRGSSNLLGGRASEFHLHPVTHVEIGSDFNLLSYLSWGGLPEIFSLDQQDKERALYSYVSTYLKEEILVEQIIRKIEPFRRFLEVAAQMNGKILNYSKISRDSGVQEKSVARYYQILDDTLLGFFLEPYHQSIRKRQSQKAKFYFFDCGVTRALQNTLALQLSEQTVAFGDLFEQFVVLEFIRLNDYYEARFKFSYLLTKDGVEIDLIVERPGRPVALVEIKSISKNREEDMMNIKSISNEFEKVDCYVLNNSTTSTEIRGVRFMNWKDGIQEIFKIK